MKVLKIIFIDIPLWIWQLPQHIVAMGFFITNRKQCEKREKNGITYYLVKHVYDCGISLGNYIFLDSDTIHYYNNAVYNHEYGHSIQSKIFGPLYVIFVGIPSVIGNIVDRILTRYNPNHYKTCHYYDQPWEYWADKLGGVDRKKYRKNNNDNSMGSI